MNIKTTLFTLLLVGICSISFSQKTVYADDIMRDLKAGKDISISNATIEGVLDFTFMDEQLENRPRKRASKKRNNTIKNKIATQISFTNCTFNDHVLAYIPDGDDTGYVFIADFEENVEFKACIFEKRAMFKHSSFEKQVSFSESEFIGRSTFKHAIFQDVSSFTNTKFENDATFKHAIFKKSVKFDQSVFEENVTLKHTMFRDGVSLAGVQFQGSLDMKHTHIKGKFDISGMKVSDDLDSKHTVINGKNFSTYLLNNK